MIPPSGWAEALALALFCPILAMVAWNDFFRLRIPNTLVLGGLLLFVALAPFLGLAEAMTRVGIATICFVICLALFALRTLGGGDTKMIPVAFLFVPSTWIGIYLLTFAGSLAVGLIAVTLARVAVGGPGAAAMALRQKSEFPVGVSIALAGMVLAGLAIRASLAG